MTLARTAAITLAALALAACAGTGGRPSAGPPSASVPSDSEVQAAAVLLRLEDRREHDPVVMDASAASASPDTRRRTALALGRIRDPRARLLLERLLGDADTAVAASAAFALGQLGDSAAVAALAPWMDATRAASAPTVVGEAAYALGKLRTTAARAAVEGFLASAPAGTDVRALGPALLAAWRMPRPAGIPPVARWLSSPDPEVRWRAAYSLSRRASGEGTRALHAHLLPDAEPDARVRALAARALTKATSDSAGIRYTVSVPLLYAAARDADTNVRVNAVRSLGTFAEAADTLAAALRSGEPYVAITAAESLGRIGRPAASAAGTLRDAALDPARTITIRHAAIVSLADVAAADALAAAGRMAAEPGWRARAAAARGVAKLGTAGRPLLETLARDRDPRVGAAALEAAVAAAGDSAVAPLRGLLVESLGARDVMVRTNALAGLTALADASTLPLLLDAYERAQRDTLNDAALAALDAMAALRKGGADPARAFFTRFPRAADPLVRLRAATTFGDTAAAPWGRAGPIETGRGTEDYARLVRESGARPRPHVVITTAGGEIELELFADDAPLTVESFLRLARAGFFDGQEWPRVVPNFVIQGGDPRGDTSGGPGYAIRDELNRHLYDRGTLGMALSGPDTGGSQWFVTHSAQPHLDGTYTVFGRVVRGLDVVDRVLPGDRIERVREVR